MLGTISEMQDLWMMQRGVYFLGIFGKKKKSKGSVLVTRGIKIARANYLSLRGDSCTSSLSENYK